MPQIKIDPVKPPANSFRTYSNPSSQGTLIRHSKKWPKQKLSRVGRRIVESGNDPFIRFNELSSEPAFVPKGLDIDSAYVDRMWSWDRNKWNELVRILGGSKGQQMGLNCLIEKASEKALIESTKYYFCHDVVAVRWVYYFNVSTGYDCQRIDFIYKPEED